MATFCDSKGREWVIAFTVPVMKRVKDRTEIHLGHLLNDECRLLKEVTGDVITFADVLFLMVQNQAEAASVTDTEFGESLAGDAFEAAVDAFMQALQDFSPSRTRPLIQALRNKGAELLTALEPTISRAIQAVNAMTPEQMMDALTFSKNATAPLASSESTPAS